MATKEDLLNGWVSCPEGYTQQKDIYILKHCVPDFYRQPLLAAMMALNALNFLVVLFIYFKVSKNLKIKTYRERVLALCLWGSIVRIVLLVMLYVRYFGPFLYIWTGYTFSMSPLVAVIIIVTYCDAYLSLLMGKGKKKLMKKAKGLISTIAWTISVIFSVILGCSAIPDDPTIRNYVVSVFFGVLALNAIILAILLVMVIRYLLGAIDRDGISEKDKLESVIEKIKSFRTQGLCVVVSIVVMCSTVILWIHLTDDRGKGFFLYYMAGFIMVETISVPIVTYATKPAEFGRGDTSSSGSGKPSSSKEVSTLESFAVELSSPSKEDSTTSTPAADAWNK